MDFQNFRQALSSDAGSSAIYSASEFEMATAAELMFFTGAPLAHVVAYREHLRMQRISRRNEEFSRRLRARRPSIQAYVLAEWNAE